MNSDNTKICPNCEKEFDSVFEYCPHCGQRNKKLELGFKHFLHDFIDSAFNLDSKIFLTLKLLILHPGKIVKLYLSGKRTMVLPPVRLYLIASLVYFTLLSFVGGDFVKWNDDGDQDIIQLDSLAGANGGLKEAVYSSDSMDVIKKDVVVTMNNLDQMAADDTDTTASVKKDGKWDKFVQSRAKKLGTEEGKETFQALTRKYINIGMFVLMPVTALIFFLLFYKDTYYIQHLVFVLYLQSLIYVLFITLNLLELLINNTAMEVISVVLFLFLLLIWTKNFYEIGWWKTVWKSILFLLMFGFSFALFFITILAISAWNL